MGERRVGALPGLPPERRTLLLIGGRIETLRKVVDLGARVVYLQHPDRFTPEHADLVDAALLADFTDWAVTRPLVEAAHASFRIDAVSTLTEPGLDTAGRVTDLLGLPGTGYRVSRLLADKRAMRRRQAEAGVDPVASAPACDVQCLSEFGRDHGYPFIVKPADGVASIGVLRIDAPDQLEDAWRHVQRVCAEPLSAPAFGTIRTEAFLAEEYLDGPEYSVEAFSFAGRHVILAVTEKATLPNFIEIGHAVPARLAAGAGAAIGASVAAFLDCMGVTDGPTHTEIRLTAAGPRVIESHPRPGGDRIIELVQAACGVDLEVYTPGWALGMVPEIADPPATPCAAATQFLTAEPGVVQSVEGAEEVRGEPDVLLVEIIVRPGDRIRPPAWSWDRPGQVAVAAPTTEAAIARCAELAGRIRIVTR